MGIFDDIRKTVNYAKRNGISAAFDAAVERLTLNRTQYSYTEPDRETLKRQQGEYSRAVFEAGKDPARPKPIMFSILTPLYLTDKEQLTQMIESVKRQSWGGWELILTDASPLRQRLGTAVDQVAHDGRIFYYELPRNEGISENTNAALKRANGDYVVLLDHDDVLAPDALYEMAKAIVSCGFEQNARGEISYRCILAYSDEDKFAEEGGGGRRYFEPHHKPDFDFDRLLTNNYICHLTTIRADIMKRFPLRAAFDGAQDYDLFLRACAGAVFSEGGYRPASEVRSFIAHVPKVLYHWRSHALSTASNPASKTYAYDAGQKAIEAFTKAYFNGAVKVEPMKHLGFYHIRYEEDVFRTRPDIGIVGGIITDDKGTLIGGRMDEEGNVFYEGLKRGQSGGYQHAAVLSQEADAVDLRNMTINYELEPLFRSVLADADEDLRNIITLVNGKVIVGDYLTPEEAKAHRKLKENVRPAGVDGESDGASQNSNADARPSADSSRSTDSELEASFARLDNGLDRVTGSAGRGGTAGRTAGSDKRQFYTSSNRAAEKPQAPRGGHIDISVGEGEDDMSLLNPAARMPKPGIPSGKKAVLKSPVGYPGAGTNTNMQTARMLVDSANEARTDAADMHEAASEIALAVIEPAELKRLSLAFCKAVREKGYRIVWDPQK